MQITKEMYAIKIKAPEEQDFLIYGRALNACKKVLILHTSLVVHFYVSAADSLTFRSTRHCVCIFTERGS
jgi:hypothetical protein